MWWNRLWRKPGARYEWNHRRASRLMRKCYDKGLIHDNISARPSEIRMIFERCKPEMKP